MRNAEQIEHWNSEAGEQWASRDDTMATLLEPFSNALMDHAAPLAADRALDIGCGGGSQTLALAARLGESASVLGVDISAPLLRVAEQRRAGSPGGARIRFEQADAAIHDFGNERFDLQFSRFGVMFFDAPAEAFAHLRAAASGGGRLVFCCWQQLTSNPFVHLPLQAALQVLPPPESPPPRAPGPFAFADRDYLHTVLQDAGWQHIDIAPAQVPMRWQTGAGFEAAVRELVNLGPIGRLLQDASDAQRSAVYTAAADLIGHYHADSEIIMDGAIWMVTAINGS